MFKETGLYELRGMAKAGDIKKLGFFEACLKKGCLIERYEGEE